jgi:hypothetical protein
MKSGIGDQVPRTKRQKDASKAPKGQGEGGKQRWEGRGTHDCAFLEPLAFPPDLPPVILMDLELG